MWKETCSKFPFLVLKYALLAFIFVYGHKCLLFTVSIKGFQLSFSATHFLFTVTMFPSIFKKKCKTSKQNFPSKLKLSGTAGTFGTCFLQPWHWHLNCFWKFRCFGSLGNLIRSVRPKHLNFQKQLRYHV